MTDEIMYYDCKAKDFVINYDENLDDNIVEIKTQIKNGVKQFLFNATSDDNYKEALNAYKKINKKWMVFSKENIGKQNIVKTIRPKLPTEKDILNQNKEYFNQTIKTIPTDKEQISIDNTQNKKTSPIKSETIDIKGLKSILSSESSLKKLSKKEENEVIAFIADERENKRELYGYSDKELTQIIKDESNSDYEEDKNDEDYTKFGKLRTKKGMGNIILFPQAVVPNASILSTKDMFNRIIKNYDTIKGKKIKNDEVAKLSCEIQQIILSNIINKKISENVKNTKFFSNDLSVYFPELITPFTLIYSDQTGINFIEGAYERLCETLGIENDDLESISSINYPTNTHNPLSDSSVFIKKNNLYYKIALSTKAGREGIGADASIIGLLPYIFDYNSKTINRNIFSGSRASFNFLNYIPFLSIKSKELIYNGYYQEIAILGIFGLLSSSYYEEFVDVLLKEWYDPRSLNKHLKSFHTVKEKAQEKYRLAEKFMNEDMHFKEVILSLLNYGAYDFAQVNIKQIPGGISESIYNQKYNKKLLEYKKKNPDLDLLLNNRLNGSSGGDGQHIKEDWHYEVSFKYPAVFEGDIKMTFAATGGKAKKLKFHIL